MKLSPEIGYLGPELHHLDRMDQVIDDFFLNNLFDGVHIEGKENIPSKGPFILGFAAHTGTSDSLSFRRHMRKQGLPIDLMSKAEGKKALPQPFRGFRMFSITRSGQVDTKAFQKGQSILSQGGIVASAFEMTRGRGTVEDLQRLRRAHRGLVFMAKYSEHNGKLGVPILPVTTHGAEHVFPIPEKIIEEKGVLRFAKDVINQMRSNEEKPHLYVTFAPLYRDHLNDPDLSEFNEQIAGGVDSRDIRQRINEQELDDVMMRKILRLADIHTHLIMFEIVRNLPDDFPLGFYKNKTVEFYQQRLTQLRASTPTP